MFDAQRLLGTLISTGMGGLLGSPASEGTQGGLPGGREAPTGSSFTQAAGGGVGRAAGLAVLGTLAYKAYQAYTQGQQAQPDTGVQGAFAGQRPFAGQGAAPTHGSSPQPATPSQLTSNDARTLIRAMVAAANADGHVDPDEEARIHQALQQSGASDDERRFVNDEMQAPASVDALAREATDAEMASHIYAASLLAIDEFNPTNQLYLRYLGNRMGLDAGTIAALHQQVGAPALA
jgi:uncharacterized membrane protein YebE (DUF533 family)